MVLYLDLGMNFELSGSLSSSVLQSTDWEITVHLRSMSASFPLKIGELADKAASNGVNGSCMS